MKHWCAQIARITRVPRLCSLQSRGSQKPGNWSPLAPNSIICSSQRARTHISYVCPDRKKVGRVSSAQRHVSPVQNKTFILLPAPSQPFGGQAVSLLFPSTMKETLSSARSAPEKKTYGDQIESNRSNFYQSDEQRAAPVSQLCPPLGLDASPTFMCTRHLGFQQVRGGAEAPLS